MRHSETPLALRLADWLDDLFDADGQPKQAAAELRRLYAENEQQKAVMRQALEALITASGNVSNDVFVKVMLARDAVSCALRAALAEQPVPVHMAALSTWDAGGQEAWHNEVARLSYATADAMLSARGTEKARNT